MPSEAKLPGSQRRKNRRLRSTRLLDRIFALLESKEWTLKYEKIRDVQRTGRKYCLNTAGNVGFTLHARKIILIDYREDVLSTAVHECLHAIFAKYSEYAIQRLERQIIDDMTRRQALKLHRLMLACLK